MPLLQVVEIILDRSLAERKILELCRLHREGLLRPWESRFASGVEKISLEEPLTVRRSAKILEIIEARRKITYNDGITVVEILVFFKENLLDLDQDDQEFVEHFWQDPRDYAQLHEINRMHLIAARLGRYFPKVRAVRYQLNEYEVAKVRSLVWQELEHRKNAKRKAFYTRSSSSKTARRGCGNDLTAMFEALNKLELAVMKSQRL